METGRVIRSAAVSGARKLEVSDVGKKPAPSLDTKQTERTPTPAASNLPAETPLTTPGYHTELVESLRLQIKGLEQQKADLQQELNQCKQQLQAQTELLEQDQSAGFKQGYQQGMDDARQQAQKDLADLRATASLFQQWLKAEFAGLEAIAAEMALAGLVKVVGTQYADEKFVLEATRQVARQVRDSTRVIVRVNKRDMDILLRHAPDLKEWLGNAVDVQADVRVQTGGCLIEADMGTLDGRLDTQIRNLQESIMAVVREAKPTV